ncbi:DUF2644 domain-containing protein [Enterococcus gallinarum]|nr:DUF2644 domain-containing protein [Enterococcus gallinarum]QCT92407.1 DUF2644 domain-containing protein [Enterococcus sp. M190262]MBO6332854.1 DUF2644 domain-containing protein [Enterococcus gallinarum]MBO6353477.1 DUF2644 domain-containing protein [Enterococcus gallinarum]MBO6395419.1 DUF2644 domain-containing protein [Enterococcus gallinarum]
MLFVQRHPRTVGIAIHGTMLDRPYFSSLFSKFAIIYYT